MEMIEFENDIQKIDQELKLLYALTNKKDNETQYYMLMNRLKTMTVEKEITTINDVKQEPLFYSALSYFPTQRGNLSHQTWKVEKKPNGHYLFHYVGESNTNYVKQWGMVLTPKIGEYCKTILHVSSYLWKHHISADIIMSAYYRSNGIFLRIPTIEIADEIIGHLYKEGMVNKFLPNSPFIPDYFGVGLIQLKRMANQFYVDVNQFDEVLTHMIHCYFTSCRAKRENRVPIQSISYENFLFYLQYFFEVLNKHVNYFMKKGQSSNHDVIRYIERLPKEEAVIMKFLYSFYSNEYQAKHLTWNQILKLAHYVFMELQVIYQGKRNVEEKDFVLTK